MIWFSLKEKSSVKDYTNVTASQWQVYEVQVQPLMAISLNQNKFLYYFMAVKSKWNSIAQNIAVYLLSSCLCMDECQQSPFSLYTWFERSQKPKPTPPVKSFSYSFLLPESSSHLCSRFFRIFEFSCGINTICSYFKVSLWFRGI